MPEVLMAPVALPSLPPYSVDDGLQRWWMLTGGAPPYWPMDYNTRWRLPSGLTCDGGCLLQL